MRGCISFPMKWIPVVEVSVTTQIARSKLAKNLDLNMSTTRCLSWRIGSALMCRRQKMNVCHVGNFTKIGSWEVEYGNDFYLFFQNKTYKSSKLWNGKNDLILITYILKGTFYTKSWIISQYFQWLKCDICVRCVVWLLLIVCFWMLLIIIICIFH